MLNGKKILGVLVGLAVLAPAPALAISEMFYHYRGIRSMGMGGLLTTTGLYEEALFNNPAMMTQGDNWKIKILDVTAESNLNFLKDHKKISELKSASDGTQTLIKLGDSNIVGRNEHFRVSNVMGYFHPHMFTENTAFGIGILANSQNNILLRSNTDIDYQLLTEVGPGMNVAHTFLDGALSVGANVRFLYRVAGNKTLKPADFLTGSRVRIEDIAGDGGGFDADIGAYYKIPLESAFKFSLGASFNDMLASKYGMVRSVLKKPIGGPTPNQRNFNVGARVDMPDFLVFSKNLFAFEFSQIGKTEPNVYSSSLKRLHIGSEHYFLSWLSFRMGFNQGYIGGGLGADLPFVKLDVATYGEEIGTNTGMREDRRLVARVAFEI